MLAVPEDASEMRLWGTAPTFSKDHFLDYNFSPSILEAGVAAEVECGQSGVDIEDSNVWHSESTSSTSCAASSDDSSDDELIDIEDEDMKRPPFSDSSYLNISELERKCRELNAIDSSMLNWKKCHRKRPPKRVNSSRKPFEVILKREMNKSGKSSTSKGGFTCACQKLKDSMEFSVTWNKMSSTDQVEAVETLTRVASLTMGLQEQIEIIRIINPKATVLPTDTEFEIDPDAFDDAKFRRIHSYVTDHLSRHSCPLCSDTKTEMCEQSSNFNHRKHSKRKTDGNLSVKGISKKSQHKGLLKRVHRQMMKEQRSGLFENEEVISLSSRNEEELNDQEVDILC